jgi:hypothetical protein
MRTPDRVTDGLKVARMPRVSHLPSVEMPGLSAGITARRRAFAMSPLPSRAHQTM